MTTRSPELLRLFAALLLVLCAFCQQFFSQEPAYQELRVLIDASKDGGLWWFPQAEAFNPDERHQGMHLAAAMKARGWQVTELGRGHRIDAETLNGHDVILIVRPWFQYSEFEKQTYVEAVRNGAKLLLLAPDLRNSGVHSAFGFDFAPNSRFGPAESWVPHSVTDQIDSVDVAWTPVLSAPKSAINLAWIGAGNRAVPIVTYLPIGKGAVLYVGHSAIMQLVEPVLNHLIESIGGLAADEFEPEKLRSRVSAPGNTHMPAPVLVLPGKAASLPQPAGGGWRFDWEDVQSAVEYELTVFGPNASVPLIRMRTSSSEFQPPERPASESDTDKPYIADHNLRNWNWQVRARGTDGVWGPWSLPGRFDVQQR